MDVSPALGTERACVVWAPGRVNLIGEHTDYSGGLVLPAAIQLGITLTVTAVTDDVALSSSSFGPAEPFGADGGGPAATGWARYGQAVAAELAALGRPAVGLSGTVDSGLPPGVGLSSSAALEVAIALGLCAVANFELEPLQIALACQRAELRAVGVPCGILDQAACLLGLSGSAVLLDCWTLEYRPVAMPVEAALLIVDSGVARALETSAYGERREELELAMRLVGAQRSTDVSAGDLEGLDGVSLQRLRHVVTENERVRRFVDALESGRLDDAGALLHESHTSLRDDYEVSIAELDLLVELAETAGAYGARLLGGGFGGAILALVPKSTGHEIGRTIAGDYRTQTGLDASTLTVFPSAGARLQAT